MMITSRVFADCCVRWLFRLFRWMYYIIPYF